MNATVALRGRRPSGPAAERRFVKCRNCCQEEHLDDATLVAGERAVEGGAGVRLAIDPQADTARAAVTGDPWEEVAAQA